MSEKGVLCASPGRVGSGIALFSVLMAVVVIFSAISAAATVKGRTSG